MYFQFHFGTETGDMFLIGLTGGIATGKSTVSKLFQELGCPVLDADLIAREVVEPGTRGWRKIRETFGSDVLLPDGRLNREKLGQIVFADSSKRQILNGITHPEIYKAIMWRLAALLVKGHQFVILDLPLLFESKKMVPYMSFTVVVACSEEQQLSRLQHRNNFSAEEAQQRINAQMPLAEKCERATHIIDNSGSMENTETQVKKLYETFQNSKLHWRLRLGVLGILVLLTVILGHFILR